MSSLRRTLEGEVLVHHLKRDERMIDQQLLARSGRTARTLVKEGPLRLTLIALAAGGDLPTHHADGPVTIHLLEGQVVFDVAREEFSLSAGDVLVLASGVPHSASSGDGCVLLLTVVHVPTGASAEAAS